MTDFSKMSVEDLSDRIADAFDSMGWDPHAVTELANRARKAESARAELLERVEKLRKLVEDIDRSDLLRHHPWSCPVLWEISGGCTCDCDALQQRINEALEP